MAVIPQQRDEYGRPIQPLMNEAPRTYAPAQFPGGGAPMTRDMAYDDGSGMAPMAAAATPAPAPAGAPAGTPPPVTPAQPSGPPSTTNVNDQVNYNRQYAAGQGQKLDAAAEQRAGDARQGRAAHSAYADEVYDPLIGNRGGYNPAEQEMIFNDQSKYQATDQDLKGNFMTPDEVNGAKGSPWDRAAFYDPEADMRHAKESSGEQRSAVDQLDTDLQGAIDPNGDLAMDPAYRDKMESAISGTAARVRGAVDPTKLRADEGALNDIRMGDEEYQRAITGAGMAAGQGSRAAADEVTRSGRAAGMSPMGIAASRSRLEKDRAVNTGDAMTNARIATGAAKASRAGQAEGIRMSGEESAADRVGSSELAAGQFETGTRGRVEDQRTAGARDLSGRRMQAATTAGTARVNTASDIAGKEAAARNFNTTTGTAIATGVEQDTAARNKDVANNRQTVNAGNQNTKFQQGTQVSNTTSGRAQVVGDARRADAKEGRAYLQTQIAGDRADEQGDYNRQVNIFGTQGTLQQGATAQQMQQNNQPKWWERTLGAVAGVANAGANVYGAR